MSENNINLKTWLENYENGMYASGDRDTMCDAGWYDWFCSDHTLLPRLKNLYPKLKAISRSSKVNLETSYVFFKNNCPMDGKLYDDFRICDIETGSVIWTICPSVGYTKTFGQSEVWGGENGFDKPIVAGNMMDVLKYFGVEKHATMEVIISEEFEDDSDENDEWCLECGANPCECDDICSDCGHYHEDCTCNEESEDEQDDN